ncbi:MAG: phosphoribosylaminoimidazolesuccinocarboxamide synthase [Flavobacteriaceae bacterium]|nr:phosphoribosylaminoimidazolesuccinocarboxamide synthase [Flavobacteriaceae bacterium]
MSCIKKLETNSSKLEFLHRGKVRDSLQVDENTRLIVVTDRISAFNKKIKTPIPNKGAVLNGIANFWFEQSKHIIPNHVIEMIDPNLMLVKEAEPIRVEMVVRGYLTGSIWRGYEAGEREFSGALILEGMSKNQKFPTPIITPTTKDEDDSPITPEEIVKTGLVSAEIWEQMQAKTLEIFNFGSEYLAEKGIILVDTKYEFGLLDGQLILIDEMHTPDSSRFWRKSDYEKNPTTAEQIDKEFVRQWMLANKIDGEVPLILAPEVIEETTNRYEEIYEMVTGSKLDVPVADLGERIRQNLKKSGLLAENDSLELA